MVVKPKAGREIGRNRKVVAINSVLLSLSKFCSTGGLRCHESVTAKRKKFPQVYRCLTNCLIQLRVFLLQSPSFAADVRQKMIRGTPMNIVQHNIEPPATLPNPDHEFRTCPTIMTEEELIRFLRIPEISSASNHRNVIENLKRKHGLPRIYLCGRAVYPTDSVKKWLQNHVTCGQ